MKILIADPEEGILFTFCEVLEMVEELEVVLARDGCEAGEFLVAEDYDVAVMELRLPCRDARQCIRDMRWYGRTTPVIAMTSVASVGRALAGELAELGVTEILCKDFDLSVLFYAISRALALSGRYPRLQVQLAWQADDMRMKRLISRMMLKADRLCSQGRYTQADLVAMRLRNLVRHRGELGLG